METESIYLVQKMNIYFFKNKDFLKKILKHYIFSHETHFIHRSQLTKNMFKSCITKTENPKTDRHTYQNHYFKSLAKMSNKKLLFA